jgi:hypothetical protein
LDGGSTIGDFKKKNASQSFRVSWQFELRVSLGGYYGDWVYMRILFQAIITFHFETMILLIRETTEEFGYKNLRGLRIMVSGKNPPMPRSCWKTWCIDQIIGAKIQSHRYYKTICPTQNVKISIIINNDTN